MKAEDLKNSILQLAMEGKLVPQNPNDEPASVLLEKIRDEKERLIKAKKIKRNNKESFIFRKNGHFYEKVGKKGEPVCIDEEIPFEIPDSWEWVRINTIREVYTGNSINKTEKETKFTGLNEGYNYIATKDVKFDNSIDYDNGVKIPWDLEKFRVASQGSVLLCIEGGSAGRKIGILNQDVCFGNKLACFKTFNENNDFLFYYLQSPNFKEIFKSKKTGIIGGVGIAKLRNVLMPIPPFNEQKRIMIKLQEVFPKINEYGVNEEKLDKLNSEFPDKLKSSILQEAIQGKLVPQNPNDEPASILLEKIREEKERLIKEKKIKRNKNKSFIYKNNNQVYEKIDNNKPICIDNEIPFEIPNSWEWVRLDTICKYIQRGKSPKYSEIKMYPVVAQKCNQWSGFSLEKAKFIDPKTVDSYKEERILQNKDIMWNSTGLGTLGRVGLYDESVNKYDWAVADSHVTIIRPFAKYVFQEFIYLFLASPTVQLVIESKAGGSTKQKELNLSTIKNYLIPLAPHNEQKRIIDKVFKLNQILG